LPRNIAIPKILARRGRGLKPLWLAPALKAGKKLEHFSIAQAAKQATKKGPTKSAEPKGDDGF